MSVNAFTSTAQGSHSQPAPYVRKKRKRTCQTVNSSAIRSFENWFGKNSSSKVEEVKKKAKFIPKKASPRMISSNPRVWCIDSFLTEGEAAKMLDCVKKLNFSASLVSDGSEQVAMEYKSSTSAVFDFQEGNIAILTKLYDKLGRLMPDVALETPLQVVRYEPGQSCALHHDSTSLDMEGRKPRIVPTDEKVIRVMTGFLYLNTLEDGATTFPKLGLSVLPKAGSLLLFPDVTDIKNLKIDGRTIHSAEQTEGVKYGINVWFQNKLM